MRWRPAPPRRYNGLVVRTAARRYRRVLRVTGTIAILAAMVAAIAAATGPSANPPAAFVAATTAPELSLYSASTGARIEQLATFRPNAFTGNGLAETSDGSAVYFTLIPRGPRHPFALKLMRIDVATRRQALVAYGWQPAVSDDGRHLAYGAVPRGLSVRDLATVLSARCVATPGLVPTPGVLGSSAAAPHSLLIATEQRGRSVLERVVPSGALTRAVTFEDSLPMAIDSSGTRLLFVLGHSPPALWEATIGRGHLTDRRRLLADSRLGPVAW
jgi:hypothetical protein